MAVAGAILWLLGDIWLLYEAFRANRFLGIVLLAPSFLALAELAGYGFLPVFVAIGVAGVALLGFLIYRTGQAWRPMAAIAVGLILFNKGGGLPALHASAPFLAPNGAHGADVEVQPDEEELDAEAELLADD